MSLNTQIKKLTVYAGDRKKAAIIKEGSEDIIGTCKVVSFKIFPTKISGKQRENLIGGKEVIQIGRVVPQFPDVYFVAEY
jgi:hypothetical protein